MVRKVICNILPTRIFIVLVLAVFSVAGTVMPIPTLLADTPTDTPTITATPTITLTPTRTPTLTPTTSPAYPLCSNAWTGSDSLGYTAGNNQSGLTTYSWVNITQTGTKVQQCINLSNDEGYTCIDIPFYFTFYGVSYDRVYASSNGFLTFQLQGKASSETVIPATTHPNALIAAFWDDQMLYLSPNDDAIYYQVVGTAPNRQLVVTFNLHDYGSSASPAYLYQVILFETTNNVKIQWNSMGALTDSQGLSATVGIENAGGTMGIQYLYHWNSGGLDSCAVEFFAPTMTLNPVARPSLRISEVFYDSINSSDYEEFVEIYNYGASDVNLTGYKVGDEETPGEGEGMYSFPSGTIITAGSTIVVSLRGSNFYTMFGIYPDFEFYDSSTLVPNMTTYTAWATGTFALGNSGDEVLLLNPQDVSVDVVTYGTTITYSADCTNPHAANAGSTANDSLQRCPATIDTNNCALDFAVLAANPKVIVCLDTRTPTPTLTPTLTRTLTPTTAPTLTPTPTNTPCYVPFYQNTFTGSLGDFTTFNCDALGANGWVYSSTSYCYAAGSLYHSYNATADNDWAITGSINISNQKCATLEFDYNHGSFDDILNVYVSQTGTSPCNDPSAWTLVAGPYAASASCIHVSVNLCAAVPGLCCGWNTLYIGFQYLGTNDFYVGIDNLVVHDNCCGSGCTPTATPQYSPTPITPTDSPTVTMSPTLTATRTPTLTATPTTPPTNTPSAPLCANTWTGSDSFGYTAGNNQSGLTSYSWVDITATGTKVQQCVNTGNDDGYTCIDLPFGFTFYGTTYDRIYAGTNGYLTFHLYGSANSEVQIPAAAHPNALIAAFWDDQQLYLSPNDDAIYYQVTGTAPNRSLVVTFKLHDYGSSTIPAYLYQAILYETTNNIKIQWNTMGTSTDANGLSATVGIENASGSTGIQYLYHWNSGGLESCAVEFFAPTVTAVPVDRPSLLITEVFYDSINSSDYEEFVEIYNYGSTSVLLDGYKIGDEETAGGTEGMYTFPTGATIVASDTIIVTLRATNFNTMFGFDPDFEIYDSSPTIPNMTTYTAYATGTWGLSNSGDELVLLNPQNIPVDIVTYGSGTTYASDCVNPHAANAGGTVNDSLQRCTATTDTDDCAVDFVVLTANPGVVICEGTRTPTLTNTPTITNTPTVTPSPTNTPCYVAYYQNVFNGSLGDITTYDCDGSGANTWAYSTSYNCTTTGSLYHSYNTNTDNDWATTGSISIVNQHCVTLEFDYTHNTSYADSLTVWVSQTGASPCSDPTAWTQVAGPYTTGATCQHVSVDLCTAVPGLCCGWNTLYVGFQYQGTDAWYVSVDNVVVHDNCCGPGCTPTATPIYSPTPTNTPSPTATPTNTPLPLCLATWTGFDTYGYTAGNNASGLTTYNWIDITTSGTKVTQCINTGNDDGYTCIEIPFDFTFYGITYNRVYAGTNGYLTFGLDGRDLSEDTIPTAGLPNALIAVFWDDQILYQTTPNDDAIFYKVTGTAPNRSLVVTYRNHIYGTSANPAILYQAILFEGSNNIKIQWNDMTGETNGNGASATAGIENETGTDGIQYFNHTTSAVLSGCAVEFFAPTMTLNPVITSPLLITEVFYDGQQTSDYDEFIEIYNPSTSDIDLTGYKIGDEETAGDTEGMYTFPASTTIAAGDTLVMALRATNFYTQFSVNPDFEFYDADPLVPNMTKYLSFGSGDFALSNSSDNVVLLSPQDLPIDVVNYGAAVTDAADCVVPHAVNASSGNSLQRCQPYHDTNDCAADFAVLPADPGDAVCVDTPTPTPTFTPTNTPAPFCSAGGTLFTSTPGITITDNSCPTVTSDTINVALAGNVGKVSVQVSITHTYDSDLDIYLRHPGGTLIELSTDNGSGGDNYTNTIFDQDATTLITSGAAPFTGYFKPEGNLSTLIGLAASGNWSLEICDDATGDEGILVSWGLCIAIQPTPTPTFTPSTTPTLAYTPTPAPIPAFGFSGIILMIIALSSFITFGSIRRKK